MWYLGGGALWCPWLHALHAQAEKEKETHESFLSWWIPGCVHLSLSDPERSNKVQRTQPRATLHARGEGFAFPSDPFALRRGVRTCPKGTTASLCSLCWGEFARFKILKHTEALSNVSHPLLLSAIYASQTFENVRWACAGTRGNSWLWPTDPGSCSSWSSGWACVWGVRHAGAMACNSCLHSEDFKVIDHIDAMDFELSRTVFDDLWCRSKMNSHRSLELSCRQVQHKAHYKAHFSTFHRDVVLCRWKLDIAWRPRLEGLMRLCSRWTAGSASGSEAQECLR